MMMEEREKEKEREKEREKMRMIPPSLKMFRKRRRMKRRMKRRKIRGLKDRQGCRFLAGALVVYRLCHIVVVFEYFLFAVLW